MTPPVKAAPFTRYQKTVIALIAVLQFTVILDFMVMSPLSDFLIKALEITPAQFGVAVSSYAFSAGIAGIMAAGFADKYDRKKMLLFFYTGFVLGTIFCGIADSYPFLLFARIITGLFGGVIGAIGMAIIADLFEINQRGRVFGFTQMAFSASQVLGIPISLVIANRWGWNSPFLMIVGLASVLGLLVFLLMKPVNKHLEVQSETGALVHLWNTVRTKRYQTGFITTALLSIGGFMLMPFGSVFSVNNLGVDPSDLVVIFTATGLCSIFIMPLIGRLADKFNKLKIFTIGSIWAVVMVLVYTNLGQLPLWQVIVFNILLFVGIISRIVPSTAMVSALPEMRDRGAFMSIMSSLQQLAGGVAAVIAGFIVHQETTSSPLENFDVLGIVVAVCILITIYGLYRVDLLLQKKKA